MELHRSVNVEIEETNRKIKRSTEIEIKKTF